MLAVLAAGDSHETRGLDPRFFSLGRGDDSWWGIIIKVASLTVADHSLLFISGHGFPSSFYRWTFLLADGVGSRGGAVASVH